MHAASPEVEFTPEWCTQHFDHLAPVLSDNIHEALSTLRGECPVAHSDAWGGFWVVTKYEDVLRVAQDWETFSSAQGVTVPYIPSPMIAIPEMVDPPVHREYKKLINYWFRPEMVLKHEDETRRLVNELIDEFIESGSCDFQSAFAQPLPGLIFFETALHAPREELAEINRLAALASIHTKPGAREARQAMIEWIGAFAEKRRNAPRQSDVVDDVLHAEIEGRPITEIEVICVLQLLLFGGLDTTAGALGSMMIRFAQNPAILDAIRADPGLIDETVEELLRLDGPFVFIARTATKDVELSGQQIKQGDKVLISWLSANHDGDEFPEPDAYSLERSSNRHIAFGAGPHRCAGSNLARMNLRISVAEIARRMHDIRLANDKPIPYHSGFNRSPEAVQISFTPAARETS